MDFELEPELRDSVRPRDFLINNQSMCYVLCAASRVPWNLLNSQGLRLEIMGPTDHSVNRRVDIWPSLVQEANCETTLQMAGIRGIEEPRVIASVLHRILLRQILHTYNSHEKRADSER